MAIFRCITFIGTACHTTLKSLIGSQSYPKRLTQNESPGDGEKTIPEIALIHVNPGDGVKEVPLKKRKTRRPMPEDSEVHDKTSRSGQIKEPSECDKKSRATIAGFKVD